MRNKTIWIFVIVFLLTAGVFAAYIGIGFHYQTHFYENTAINGVNVSDLTVQEAEQLIAKQAETFSLEVTTREGTVESIPGNAMGYHFVSGGEVQSILEEQSILTWLPAYVGGAREYTIETAAAYDAVLLDQAADALACVQNDQIQQPKDACLQIMEDGTYGIVPEVQGNQLDLTKVKAALKTAMDAGTRTVNLDADGCYLAPKVLSDNGSLKAEAAIRNRYLSMSITYQMGGEVTEVLDGATISNWYSLDQDLQVTFDREKVAAWVTGLAAAYDTIGTMETFRTSRGETVYAQARTYGWQINQEEETEALYLLLGAGETTSRSPIYYESARSRGENDLGNTYIEIDYTNQRMWVYKDGALLLETPVVTGNVSAGNASPEGIFCLVGKEEHAVLVGEDYKTPVDYWMPFFGGVGIHDANSWRTEYGGNIYQWGGSHGCINTPTDKAAMIYHNIEVGTPIICYNSGIDYGYSTITVESTAVPNYNTEDIIIIGEDGYEMDVTVEDFYVIPENNQNTQELPSAPSENPQEIWLPDYSDPGSYDDGTIVIF